MVSRVLAFAVLAMLFAGSACGGAAAARLGAGPPFLEPWGLALDRDGALLVTDTAAGAVFRVDLASGDRTVLAAPGAGPDGRVALPSGIARMPGRRLAVADAGRREIHLLREGSLSLLSGADRGRGPAFKGLLRLFWVPGLGLGVLDEGRVALLLVDPSSGDRSLLSGGSSADRDLLVDAMALPDGRIAELFELREQIAVLEPSTRERRVLCELWNDEGPAMVAAEGLSPGPSGEILVGDNWTGRILAVDPSTGARTLRLDPWSGSGPVLAGVKDMLPLPSGEIAVSIPYWRTVLAVAPDGKRRVLSGDVPPLGAFRLIPTALRTAEEGRLLVCDAGGRRLVLADPASRRFEEVSGPARGSGPSFEAPVAVAGPYVMDKARGLVRVDPGTGDRTVVCPPARVPGSPFPVDLALGPDGTLFLSSQRERALFRWEEGRFRPLGGGGVALDLPERLLALPSGDLLLTDGKLPALLRVDPETGDREVVSGLGRGAGPPLGWPVGLASEGDAALLSDEDADTIVRVDLATGNRTLVTSPERPGMRLYRPVSLAVAGGRVLVADPGIADLVEVDPRTGQKTSLQMGLGR